MRYDFAPMEGITDSMFRRLHHQYFPGVDRYYMPFLSPTVHRQLTPREARELPYAASESFTAIPQLLTKNAEDFLWAASVCADRGYEEVNLNIGCPSGTVVAKGKGSGMLRDLESLERFLDTIFQSPPLPISVKTRIGLESPEEFPAILDLYNRYPIAELTIHPRIRKQFYDGDVFFESFAYAAAQAQMPLNYNGDVTSLSQAQAIAAQYPQLNAIMIGRGLIADPGMLCGGTGVQALEGFLTELMAVYQQAFGGSRNAIFRMKEHWGFLHHRFPGCDKLWKRLRKSTDAAEFQSLTLEILHTIPYV